MLGLSECELVMVAERHSVGDCDNVPETDPDFDGEALALELRHFEGEKVCVAEWDGEKGTLGLSESELVMLAERHSVGDCDKVPDTDPDFDGEALALELRHFEGEKVCVAEWDGEKVTLGLPDGELVVEAERQSVDVGDNEAVIVDDKQRELLWLMVLDTDPVLDTVEVPEALKHRVGVRLTEADALGLPETENVPLTELVCDALRHFEGVIVSE